MKVVTLDYDMVGLTGWQYELSEEAADGSRNVLETGTFTAELPWHTGGDELAAARKKWPDAKDIRRMG